MLVMHGPEVQWTAFTELWTRSSNLITGPLNWTCQQDLWTRSSGPVNWTSGPCQLDLWTRPSVPPSGQLHYWTWSRHLWTPPLTALTQFKTVKPYLCMPTPSSRHTHFMTVQTQMNRQVQDSLWRDKQIWMPKQHVSWFAKEHSATRPLLGIFIECWHLSPKPLGFRQRIELAISAVHYKLFG